MQGRIGWNVTQPCVLGSSWSHSVYGFGGAEGMVVRLYFERLSHRPVLGDPLSRRNNVSRIRGVKEGVVESSQSWVCPYIPG